MLQFSLRSRCTAVLTGFFVLIHAECGPDSIGRSTRLDTMPSSTRPSPQSTDLNDLPPLRYGRTSTCLVLNHSGGTVAYSGQTAVPCGAFSFPLHRPLAAVGPGPHLPVQHRGARVERRSAGNDHDAAQVSRVTIA